jgi:hypothetical protein
MADEDSGQCITHHDELATSCAWTCDGQQLLSISDAGVTCSRRAPPSSASAGGDDDDTLDGGLWLDASIALPAGSPLLPLKHAPCTCVYFTGQAQAMLNA